MISSEILWSPWMIFKVDFLELLDDFLSQKFFGRRRMVLKVDF
jgi:hypothetical protein